MRHLTTALLAVTLTASWSGLGGSDAGGGVSASPTAASNYPSLAIDAQGRPWIAWEELSLEGQSIYLRRWTGTAWEGLGGSDTGFGIGNLGGGNETPSLALDSAGRPVVAWRHDFGIVVARWTDADWEFYPAPYTWPDDNGSAFYIKIRLDAFDQPVVSWMHAPIVTDVELPSQIYVKRWNGSAWEELGGSASGTGISNALVFAENPDLALDPEGRPIVAWAQFDGLGYGFAIQVKRWDGTAWVAYGGSGAAPGIASEDPENFAISGAYPSIATDLQGNPVVAWHEYGLSAAPYGEIYVRAWNGSAWVELGGSGSGGGISAAGEAGTRHPSLKVGPTGLPTVAWQNGPLFSTDEIYLKRWNGETWEELAGSAGGGGVSGTPAVSSAFASVALTPAGDPGLAWVEGYSNINPSTPEIWYRQLGSAPAPFQATAMTPAPGSLLTEIPAELTVSLSAVPDPTTVNGVSVVLQRAGQDEELGTLDDEVLSPAVSVADAQIKVDLTGLKMRNGLYRLSLLGIPGTGPGSAVRDASGQLLDGEYAGAFPSGDGTPGGTFVAEFRLKATGKRFP